MKRIAPLIVILLLALLLRIIHIGFPAGGFMALQQTGTATTAYGFFTHGFDQPSLQGDAGNPPQDTRSLEFPFYAGLVSFCYTLFTPCDTWGRILSVLFSLFTIIGVYRLAQSLLGRRTALWAALFYTILPLNVFYGRAIMSDSLLLMCTVWGLFYFSKWSAAGAHSTLFLSAFLVACAVLLRFSTVYLVIPLLALATQRGWGAAFRNRWHWVYILIVAVPAAGWYYHVYRSGSGTGVDVSLLLTPGVYSNVLFHDLAGRHLTYAGTILFLFGIFVPRQKREEMFLDWWLGGAFVYILLTVGLRQTDEYYQLPFTLPACLFMAKAANEILSPDNFRQYWRRKRGVLVLVALCLALLPILSALRIGHYLGEERFDDPVLQLGTISQRMIPADEKVIAVDRGSPLLLYACRRDGWHASADDVTPASALALHFRGASFVVGTTAAFDTRERQERLYELLHAFPALVRTDGFFIIRLVMEPDVQ